MKQENYQIQVKNPTAREMILRVLYQYGYSRRKRGGQKLEEILKDETFDWSFIIVFPLEKHFSGNDGEFGGHKIVTFEELLDLLNADKGIVVKLNDEYSATVTKDGVKTNIGDFPLEAIDQLAALKEEKPFENIKVTVKDSELIFNALKDLARKNGYTVSGSGLIDLGLYLFVDEENALEARAFDTPTFGVCSKDSFVSQRCKEVPLEELIARLSNPVSATQRMKLKNHETYIGSRGLHIGCQTFDVGVINKLVEAKKKVLGN